MIKQHTDFTCLRADDSNVGEWIEWYQYHEEGVLARAQCCSDHAEAAIFTF